jgi:hypothetical protein
VTVVVAVAAGDGGDALFVAHAALQMVAIVSF